MFITSLDRRAHDKPQLLRSSLSDFFPPPPPSEGGKEENDSRRSLCRDIERIITGIPCTREMKWRICSRARFYPSPCRLHPSTGGCTHERPRTYAHLRLSLTRARLPDRRIDVSYRRSTPVDRTVTNTRGFYIPLRSPLSRASSRQIGR